MNTTDDPRPDYFRAYREAQAAATELITLRLLGEQVEPVLDARMAELELIPHAMHALVGILIESVAAQWGSVEEFSQYVITALANDDTQRNE